MNRAIAQKLNNVRMVGEGINEIVHITDALRRATDLGLDLVLVSDTVTPPVVRIQDFKKIEYEKKKARKASSSKQAGVLKEIQLKVNISDHDLGTKIKKIEEFIEKKDKVKVCVRLKGRERENAKRAYELIEKVAEAVSCKVAMIGAAKDPTAMLEPNKPASK